MKNILVKVNSAASTIAQHQIVTADGKPTVIQALENVNYQLVDKATGVAPDHILTMRKGNDLLISMSEDNDDVDLIISDYYNNSAALVGQAENGTYYNYIPDTGEVADYVTQLEAGNVSGHALGGEIIATPYWVAAPSEGFGVLPWLLGAGALALAGLALAGGGGDDKKGTDDSNIDYAVTDFISKANQPAGATNDKLSGTGDAGNIIFFDDNNNGKLDDGETSTTVGEDGKWQLDIPETPEGSDVNPINEVDSSRTILVADKAGNILSKTNNLYVFDSVFLSATYSMHDRPQDAKLVSSTDVRGDGSNQNGLVFDYTPVGGDITIISTGAVNALDTSSNGNTGDEFKTLTGAGNDLVVIKGNVDDDVHFDLGAGNDVLDLGNGLGGFDFGVNFVYMGEGNDVIKVFGDVGNGSKVFMGQGNDTASINGDIANTNITVIDGGEGNDTLNLTKSGLIREAINIENIKNFETIDMEKGNIELDIAYTDLVNSTSEKLYVKGNGNDVVDLGDNDFLGSTNLNDGSGSWSTNTSKRVDGTNYDVYQHSADSSGSHLVYIEQGVSVI